jgi:hypothetical protein
VHSYFEWPIRRELMCPACDELCCPGEPNQCNPTEATVSRPSDTFSRCRLIGHFRSLGAAPHVNVFACWAHVSNGSNSEVGGSCREVRFTLNGRLRQPGLSGPKSARKRLAHCNKLHRYSITSALPSSDSGRRGRSTAPLPLCRGPRSNRRGDHTVDLAWKTSNGGCHAELARELDERKIL